MAFNLTDQIISFLFSIRGGAFTKNNYNNSNSTTIEIQKEGVNFENVDDITRLNRAHGKSKEKFVSTKGAARSLKDKYVDLKPEAVDTPVFKPEIIEKPSDFKPNTTSNILNNAEKDREKNIQEIIKEMRRNQKIYAEKEIARKELLKKQYDKLHIKKFARDNLKLENRVRFIHLPLSNKEIFEDFVLKNKNIIKYGSYLLNFILVYFSLNIFKLLIINNSYIFYMHYANKNFKSCIKPIIKLLITLIIFISILSFGPRTIKFIILKLLYSIFIFYKFLLYKLFF